MSAEIQEYNAVYLRYLPPDECRPGRLGSLQLGRGAEELAGWGVHCLYYFLEDKMPHFCANM